MQTPMRFVAWAGAAEIDPSCYGTIAALPKDAKDESLTLAAKRPGAKRFATSAVEPAEI